MREYDSNEFIKPPGSDVPLFAHRAGEPDLNSAHYEDHVPLELRRRTTWVERNGRA